jgi:hypothetical protein
VDPRSGTASFAVATQFRAAIRSASFAADAPLDPRPGVFDRDAPFDLATSTVGIAALTKPALPSAALKTLIHSRTLPSKQDSG